MGKNTFGKTMPRALSQNLKIMGEQIMLARKRRHLSMQDIADRATVTRLTVSKVEHGDPTVSMGIYARVLFALNLENDIILLAADDALGRQLQDAELLRKWIIVQAESYMLERQEASEIIEEVRAAIKDWRKTAAELQIPIKLLESYSIRWDELRRPHQ